MIQHSRNMDQFFNRRADELIAKRRYDEARALLQAALQAMPADWIPKRENDRAITVAYWDQEEFFAHTDYTSERNQVTESIVWVGESYSKAWYQLAVVEIEQGRFEQALFCLDCGLDLEPDHPELWNEKGYALGQLKRHEEAYEAYVQAATVRDWAPPSQLARALRGQGVQLVDLQRLDEAEAALERSLEFEPDNENAHHELDYIKELRRKLKEEKKQIPWFLHSLINPRTDPLTVSLLTLVEDLPSIPGPQTVGSDNYSRIFDAFEKRGWAGFEEEFDRIVPRHRSDYADVKRDLLCEPFLRLTVHRRLADAVLGRKSVEEIFDEIRQARGKKPH